MTYSYVSETVYRACRVIGNRVRLSLDARAVTRIRGAPKTDAMRDTPRAQFTIGPRDAVSVRPIARGAMLMSRCIVLMR